MTIYFSTVVRTAPIHQGGELIKLDWDRKKISARQNIVPENPDVSSDLNPRGKTRGCRGIEIVNNRIIAANFHSLEIFDRNLNKIKTISNENMVGLHEIYHTKDQKIWVSSTTIDGALLIDLKTGETLDQYWPRDMNFFQSRFNLTPLQIDKEADNRDKFLVYQKKFDNSHLHLNAVKEFKGEVFALFNKLGVVANLTKRDVLLQDKRIVGAHNILFPDERTLIINNTKKGRTMLFDINNQSLIKELNLKKYRVVRNHIFWSWINYKIAIWLRKLKIKNSIIAARPLFVRGLHKIDNLLFVGISPAMILCFDLNKERLIDYYIYSKDTRVAIHGIHAVNE
jgi:hypothetical protein